MTVERYPLTWPLHIKRTEDPKRARFGIKDDKGWKKELSISEARKRLLSEIDKITKPGHSWRVPPDSIIISSNIQVRLDGLPYSNRKNPDDTGVAVYFDLDGDTQCFPCDKWDRVADNIAAIALHIGAMRGIERWGVSDLKTAFAGFKALPESSSTQDWWKVLEVNQNSTFDEVVNAYRRLSKKYHPDLGDTTGRFYLINEAYEKAKKQFNK